MRANRLWLFGVSCTAICTLPAVAQAQQADEGQATSSRGEIEEIIVTAQKRSERLRDVPFSIVALTPTQLEAAGVVGTRDLPSLVPGLTFTSVGPWVAPTMRGITTTANGSGQDSPIAIYLDGIYQSSQAGNAFGLPDVSRIEVLKGPQGTLFGRNVVGGAILIHTREPSYETTGKFSISDGIYFGGGAKTANEFYVNGFVSGPLVEGKVAVSLAGALRYNDGYLTNDVNGERAGSSNQKYVRAKILIQPSVDVKLLVSAMYDKSRDGVGSAYFPLDGNTPSNARDAMGALIYPNRIMPTKPWHLAYERQPVIVNETYGVTARGDIETGAGTVTSLTGYYSTSPDVFTDFDGTYAPDCLPTLGCLNFSIFMPLKTFSQEINFASSQFGPLTLTLGGNYYYSRSRSTQNANAGAILVRNQVATRAWALYGETNIDLTDRLTVIGGVRYSSEKKTLLGLRGAGPLVLQNEASWNSVTPRASLRYRVSEVVNAYATFSKGFKSGVLDTTSFTNTPLKPEDLTAYEVGIKAQTYNFSFNASAFYYDYKNLQMSIYDPPNSILRNAARARIYGLDADATYKVSEDFQLRLGAAWLPYSKYKSFPNAINFLHPLTRFGLTRTTIDATGLRTMRSPRLTGNVAFDYSEDLSAGRLSAMATLSYSSSYKWDVLGTIKTAQYATLSGQIGFEPKGTGFKLGVYGRNLTNQASIVSVSPATITGVSFSPPRQVGISAEYSF
jgi:iron complex outermembrane receptor protein